MRILISGGAGFIGSHLSERLIQEGHDVVVLDNLCTGTLDNLRSIQDHSRFTFIQHDITQPLELPGILDVVLNFASPASPVDYMNLPLETMRVGSLGTEHMAQLALANNARFIQASTSEIYGDPLVHPQTEDYLGNVSCIGPRSVYDEAKRYAEALLMAYHRSFGLNIGIIRIFNTYGPRMRTNDGRAVPEFINNAMANEPLLIHGDGLQTRSLCYITDLVDGILKMMVSDHKGPINLGNPEEITILALAQEIRDLLHSKSEIKHIKASQDDPNQRKPDITLAKSILGWIPKIYRHQGLQETLRYYNNRRNEL